MAEPSPELLARLAYAGFLYAQARQELAHAIAVQKTLALAATLAHEQVQEKRLELLSEKDEPPLAKHLFEAFIVVALSLPAIAKGVQAATRASMGGFHGAFHTSAADRAVEVTRFRLPRNRLAPAPERGPSRLQLAGGGTRLHDPRLDPGRPPSPPQWEAAASDLNFADALASRLTLGELHAYQEKSASFLPIVEPLLQSGPAEEAPDPLPPDAWPQDLVFDTSQMTAQGPRRRIAPGFKADAGRTAAGIQIRQQAEARAVKMELSAELVLAELGFTLELARMLAWGAQPAAVKAALAGNDYAHPLLEDPHPVAELTEMLISDLLLIPSPQSPPKTPLDRIRDENFVALEKCLWMTLYGGKLQVREARVVPQDAAGDDRLILGAPEALVQYWWARFKDPLTGKPFPNRVLLFSHLQGFKDRMDEALKVLEKHGFGKV